MQGISRSRLGRWHDDSRDKGAVGLCLRSAADGRLRQRPRPADLVLRDLAMLYPAAFAPDPVFDLPGWYDDEPWGYGFERPATAELARTWTDARKTAEAAAQDQASDDATAQALARAD